MQSLQFKLLSPVCYIDFRERHRVCLRLWKWIEVASEDFAAVLENTAKCCKTDT